MIYCRIKAQINFNTLGMLSWTLYQLATHLNLELSSEICFSLLQFTKEFGKWCRWWTVHSTSFLSFPIFFPLSLLFPHFLFLSANRYPSWEMTLFMHNYHMGGRLFSSCGFPNDTPNAVAPCRFAPSSWLVTEGINCSLQCLEYAITSSTALLHYCVFR